MAKPLIAVFSGPMATIQNSPDLITSDKALVKRGLPVAHQADGTPKRFDSLRPQRLARPVTVYIEQFSAHPLESDEAELYGPPDGYLSADGEVSPTRRAPDDRGVYEVELRPEDGLYLLPYMATQADGSPWLSAFAGERAIDAPQRQTFFPSAERIFEEIDRFGMSEYGETSLLSSLADYEFHRAAPAGGYRHGDSPETIEVDFFPYSHFYETSDPPRAALARLTNRVNDVLSSGKYLGGTWLEGSPTVEDTLYWLHLLIDCSVPIVGHSAQRRRQTIGGDADKNILDGVRYIVSKAWADEDDHDTLGALLIVDGLGYGAREVTKTAARPGNYIGSGAAGGVLAVIDDQGEPEVIRYSPKRHTSTSLVNLSRLPDAVHGVTARDGMIEECSVAVKDADGHLLETSVPLVIIEKLGFYHAGDPNPEVGISAWVREWLADEPLAGIVVEGKNPYGVVDKSTTRLLRQAIFSGFPVVMTGRGNPTAQATRGEPIFIAGSDLMSSKARMLLMASLLSLGALPPARDPSQPTRDEYGQTMAAVARYQEFFDQH